MSIKIINSKIHGILDYLVSLILIISPWLLEFADGKSEMFLPIILGISSIIYSLFTKYELGVLRILPFKTHLAFDTLSGILLSSSPWIFGFADVVYLPHLIFGILEISVVSLSKTEPESNLSTFSSRHP